MEVRIRSADCGSYLTVSLLKELLVGGVGDGVYSGVRVSMCWARKCAGGVMETKSIRLLRNRETGNGDLALRDCSLSAPMPDVAVCVRTGIIWAST